MSLNEHVQRIISWRESFVTLPDSHFFELIRMYLGEIHSPFNKQKLVEQLGAFLRREEIQKTIVSLLSENDIQILAAVRHINDSTQEKLASFFSGTFSFALLYERLLNLEERLLIYRYADKRTGKQIIAINPMLEEVLEPYTSISAVLSPSPVSKVNFNVQTALSPEFIASFISFVSRFRDLCRADGTLKKRVSAEVRKFFGERAELLQPVATAFINLSILIETEDGYEINQTRLRAFAELDEEKQYAYLCVSSFGHFSRNQLVRQAGLLIDTALSTGDAGFTRQIILRKALLISDKYTDSNGLNELGGTGRFARMMARSRETQESVVTNHEEKSEDGASVMDRLFETAVLMGFFDQKGKTEDGEDVYVTGYFLKNRVNRNPNSSGGAKVLSIDAAFNVTIMPVLRLKDLISLVSFMDIRQFDTAALFEINKKSIMRSFDYGFSRQEIIDLLSKYSAYELPQNLLVSINEWNDSYSSACVYKGYILQVNRENSLMVEKNPVISAHISKTLAEGIYLLDVVSDEEIAQIIERSGLDFIGRVKETDRHSEAAAFPDFTYNAEIPENDFEGESRPVLTPGQRADHFENMRNELEKLQAGSEQKDGLLLRIKRKIVLIPEQLKPETVHFERIEASGMDFSGKVHIIEDAIASDNMVEIEYTGMNPDEPKSVRMLGTPLSIEKHEYDSIVRMIIHPEEEARSFSISRASCIKKIRGSILR